MSNVQWTTTEVLKSLARRGLSAGSTFTSVNLKQWLPDLSERSIHCAVSLLIRKYRALSFSQVFVDKVRCSSYVVTEAGAKAIREARAGRVIKCGSKMPPSPSPNSMTARLWALIKARRIIDLPSAIETLVDAGQDTRAAEIHIRGLLRRWELAGFLTASKNRISGGFKRYVICEKAPVTVLSMPSRAKENGRG